MSAPPVAAYACVYAAKRGHLVLCGFKECLLFVGHRIAWQFSLYCLYALYQQFYGAGLCAGRIQCGCGYNVLELV